MLPVAGLLGPMARGGVRAYRPHGATKGTSLFTMMGGKDTVKVKETYRLFADKVNIGY